MKLYMGLLVWADCGHRQSIVQMFGKELGRLGGLIAM